MPLLREQISTVQIITDDRAVSHHKGLYQGCYDLAGGRSHIIVYNKKLQLVH